jgi:cysteine desulfurase
VSLVLRGVKADGVLLDLDLSGIAASSGSACAALTRTTSHVLRAIGCAQDEAEGALSFTLGRWTTAAEIDAVLERLPPIVSRLRALSIPAPRRANPCA